MRNEIARVQINQMESVEATSNIHIKSMFTMLLIRTVFKKESALFDDVMLCYYAMLSVCSEKDLTNGAFNK